MNGFNVAEFNAGLIYATPEIFLGAAACAILMLDLFISDSAAPLDRRARRRQLGRDRRAGGSAAGIHEESWRSADCSNWIAWRRC